MTTMGTATPTTANPSTGATLFSSTNYVTWYRELAELLRGMRFARDMVVYDTVLSDAVRASVSKNWEA